MSHFCGACGSRSEPEATFCVDCGARLRSAPESADPRDDIAPEDRTVLRHAVELIARREVATAITVLERLCAEQPKWGLARAYLGIAYLRATRVADSRAELEEAVRLSPGSFICHMKYGEFLARLGFYDQAVRELDLAFRVPAPDGDTRQAAMALRQFSKDKSKGLFYREISPPRFHLRHFLPRRFVHAGTNTTPIGEG